MSSLKKNEQESSSRGEEKNTVSKFFDFRENDYNSAVNTHFWAMSKFNKIANFYPLMANDGSLESSHQGEFV